MSPPAVPPGGTPAPAAKSPAIRKAKWQEPVTPSPDKLFLAWYEEERRRFHPNAADGLPAKLLPRWSEWFTRALAHPLIGGDVEKLRETCRRWFVDPWGRDLRTPCPASAFIADHIWSQHIPGQREGSAPAQETPAESRRRADAAVGRGEEPDAPCATGCGAPSAQAVWGHGLCRPCSARLEVEEPRLSASTVAAWVASQRAHADAHAGGLQ
ncbi:hypothetical protein [Myxococcus sp. Y35]|uniref:hypothetical protein n=1 Tax=Pseudomyxococcus flavus TaxID=3115648 RepID=UPI003CFAE9DD